MARMEPSQQEGSIWSLGGDSCCNAKLMIVSPGVVVVMVVNQPIPWWKAVAPLKANEQHAPTVGVVA